MPLIQPFAALYVLILATLAPLMAKESERIYGLMMKPFRRRRRPKHEDEAESEAEITTEQAIADND